jgi:hypothetical protein
MRLDANSTRIKGVQQSRRARAVEAHALQIIKASGRAGPDFQLHIRSLLYGLAQQRYVKSHRKSS